MIIDEEDYMEHYGTPRHSGRYPWGSGDNVSGAEPGKLRKPQRSISFLDSVKELKDQGLTDKQVADALGLDSIGQLRARKTISRNEKKQYEIDMAWRLRNKGLSNGEIATRMQASGESYIRTLLADGAKDKVDVLTQTSNMLKDEVDSKGFIQIGTGVEHNLGMSSEKLRAAVDILKEQGYVVHTPKVPQIGTGKETKVKTLGPPGATWGDAQKALNAAQVHLIGAYSDDGGRSFVKIHPPLPIDPKRVGIRYKEDGGAEADGVIYVRPGVKDVSIGNARYSQVRVKVGDNHYLKGMAMYKDGLPKGVDLQFNTIKSDSGNKLDAMKDLESDPDFPFKTIVRQITADKGLDTEHVTSVMNIVGTKEGSGEEGSWGTWKKSLSSQFLSKQSPHLAQAQLDMTQERRKKEFDEIMSLTNPVIKKKLLDKFADKTDSSAAHLDAAQLHRQAWHVILPVNTLKPNEVYAPNFRDGEQVVLVRYPHAGTFEIPELTVNNKHREARELLGTSPPDAIAIHHEVAQRLSGADFDGDAVLVIPNRSRKVTHTKALEGLKDFDPNESFKGYDGMKVMTDYEKQMEMGKISNLITDMTIKLAPHDEIARAVRHSMVVIDAQKKELNWRESERQNGIPALRKEYQGKTQGGASTLLSKATSELRVLDRKDRPQSQGGPIDLKTGRREFVPSNKIGRDGKLQRIKTTKLAEAHDAHTLSSGTPMEKIYAEHSNKLKDLANKARLESVKTPRLKRSKSAAQVYASEVEALKSKLIIAEKNSPLERQAQIVANQQTRLKRQANPNLSKDLVKKIGFKELETARARLKSGKKERMIQITPKEWDAIQAGAISHSVLERILNNTELDKVKKLATPRREVLMTSAKTLRAKQMLNSGYTRAQVADQLGVSLSTLDKSTSLEGM